MGIWRIISSYKRLVPSEKAWNKWLFGKGISSGQKPFLSTSMTPIRHQFRHHSDTIQTPFRHHLDTIYHSIYHENISGFPQIMATQLLSAPVFRCVPWGSHHDVEHSFLGSTPLQSISAVLLRCFFYRGGRLMGIQPANVGIYCSHMYTYIYIYMILYICIYIYVITGVYMEKQSDTGCNVNLIQN